VVRGRGKKSDEGAAAPTSGESADARMDVNAVVSYNLKAIRERRGITQDEVARRLARLTGHLLPQASISAMERGFDGERRRRFDAHELYLLATVFNVPIVYFFIPPPHEGLPELADTHRPLSELYAAVLGRDDQLTEVDERLTDLRLTSPEEVDDLAAALFGGKDSAARNWHDHYRTWRKKRLVEIARNYGDRLDEVAEFLGTFANEVSQLGPHGYLQSISYKRGEEDHVRFLLDQDVED